MIRQSFSVVLPDPEQSLTPPPSTPPSKGPGSLSPDKKGVGSQNDGHDATNLSELDSYIRDKVQFEIEQQQEKGAISTQKRRRSTGL